MLCLPQASSSSETFPQDEVLQMECGFAAGITPLRLCASALSA
jgi:hypothetical protein